MNIIDNLKALSENQGFDPKYIKEMTDYAKRLLFNKVPIIFDTIHFSLLTDTQLDLFHDILLGTHFKYYFHFEIPKKNGNIRTIDAPEPTLKFVQRMILFNILQNIEVSKYCHGFTTRRSIVTNASQHVGQKLVYNLDLQDFFPSIKQSSIKRIFRNLGYNHEVSFLLASICCLRESLPQGAPTSPYLSNIICLKLDKRLGKLAESNGLVYSRYADDLTFSGGYHIKKLRKLIKEIINDEGFNVHPQKERLLFSNMQQTVTGLTVNSKVGIPRKFLNNLRQEIYYAKKLGPEFHSEKLIENGHLEYSKLNLKGYLYGKVLFVNSVNPVLADKFFEELKYIYWE